MTECKTTAVDSLDDILAVSSGYEIAPLLSLVVVQREALPGQPQQLGHSSLAGGVVDVGNLLLLHVRQVLVPGRVSLLKQLAQVSVSGVDLLHPPAFDCLLTGNLPLQVPQPGILK